MFKFFTGLFIFLLVISTLAMAQQVDNDISDKVLRYEPLDDARYRGIFDVRVIEPNQAQYILGVKFQSGYNKPIDFILRPYNGKANIETYQPIYQSNNGEDKRSFKITHKYYVSIRIREDSDHQFSAQVSLFRRAPDSKIDINKPYHYRPSDFVEISSALIKGELNQANEYLFVDRKDVKFYLKLNFDIVFTEQEIIERFKNSQKN